MVWIGGFEVRVGRSWLDGSGVHVHEKQLFQVLCDLVYFVEKGRRFLAVVIDVVDIGEALRSLGELRVFSALSCCRAMGLLQLPQVESFG